MTLASNLGELDRHINEVAAKRLSVDQRQLGGDQGAFMPASPSTDITVAVAKRRSLRSSQRQPDWA